MIWVIRHMGKFSYLSYTSGIKVLVEVISVRGFFKQVEGAVLPGTI